MVINRSKETRINDDTKKTTPPKSDNRRDRINLMDEYIILLSPNMTTAFGSLLLNGRGGGSGGGGGGAALGRLISPPLKKRDRCMSKSIDGGGSTVNALFEEHIFLYFYKTNYIPLYRNLAIWLVEIGVVILAMPNCFYRLSVTLHPAITPGHASGWYQDVTSTWAHKKLSLYLYYIFLSLSESIPFSGI